MRRFGAHGEYSGLTSSDSTYSDSGDPADEYSSSEYSSSEYSSSEDSSSEYSSSEYSSSEYSDLTHSDGRHSASEYSDPTYSDDRHSASEYSDPTHSDDRHSASEYSELTHSDGRHSADEHSELTYSDSRHSASENSDRSYSDVEDIEAMYNQAKDIEAVALRALYRDPDLIAQYIQYKHCLYSATQHPLEANQYYVTELNGTLEKPQAPKTGVTYLIEVDKEHILDDDAEIIGSFFSKEIDLFDPALLADRAEQQKISRLLFDNFNHYIPENNYSKYIPYPFRDEELPIYFNATIWRYEDKEGDPIYQVVGDKLGTEGGLSKPIKKATYCFKVNEDLSWDTIEQLDDQLQKRSFAENSKRGEMITHGPVANLQREIQFAQRYYELSKQVTPREGEYMAPSVSQSRKGYGAKATAAMPNEGQQDLFNYIEENLDVKDLDFERNFEIALGIAIEIAIAQSANIIHGDIKPENILINDKTKRIALIDFGLSAEGAFSRLSGGTREYLALERSIRYQGVTHSVDTYSFVAIWIILCLPFL